MQWEKQSPDFHDRAYGPVTAHKSQAHWAGVRWSGEKRFAGFGNTATYPPGLYLPAMVGWKIAQEANLTMFASLRLARWLTALMAALAGMAGTARGPRQRHGMLLAALSAAKRAVSAGDGLAGRADDAGGSAWVWRVVWRALSERRELTDVRS